MKKILLVSFTTLLLLGACGQKEESTSNTNDKPKKEVTKENPKKDKDSEKKEQSDKQDTTTDEESTEETKNEPTTNEEQSTEESSTEENASTEEQTTDNSLDYNNVADRNSLVQILNGNYSEEQKVAAYNSAVSNGVLPQGNVMEGSAQSAYESSLRVESGQEKSIYDQSSDTEEESYDYENNGVYRTPDEQSAHEDWVNGQDEWNNASESEKVEIRKRNAEEYGYEYDSDDYVE